MALRVQCPHCKCICQVGEEQRGSSVKCGSCGRLYGLPPAAPPKPASAAARPSAPSPPMPLEDEDEISIELDGPAAAALLAPAAKPSATRIPAPLANTCRLEIGAATSAGRVRDRNEDSLFIQHMHMAAFNKRREVAVLVVADGMGGHGAGDRASDLVARTVGASLASIIAAACSGIGQEPALPLLADQVAASLKEAHRAVLQQAQKEPSCRGMGATAAVVLVWEATALIGHVGDCRVYHQHDDKLAQVTRDQTLVARMVELGKLTPQEALTHPQRNEVTQAVGRGAELRPAAHQVKLVACDWLIIACDGLHAHVDERMLADAILEAGPSASSLASRLIELANECGGSDNCTVVAVRCY